MSSRHFCTRIVLVIETLEIFCRMCLEGSRRLKWSKKMVYTKRFQTRAQDNCRRARLGHVTHTSLDLIVSPTLFQSLIKLRCQFVGRTTGQGTHAFKRINRDQEGRRGALVTPQKILAKALRSRAPDHPRSSPCGFSYFGVDVWTI